MRLHIQLFIKRIKKQEAGTLLLVSAPELTAGAAIPTLSIASGAGYRSYLAKENNTLGTPGASGAGAHPIILSVSGNAQHTINGVTTGNEALKPIVSTDVRCFDGTKYGAGQPAPTYCGNTSGNPGAVVISW